jgi:hypothetical protein
VGLRRLDCLVSGRGKRRRVRLEQREQQRARIVELRRLERLWGRLVEWIVEWIEQRQRERRQQRQQLWKLGQL